MTHICNSLYPHIHPSIHTYIHTSIRTCIHTYRGLPKLVQIISIRVRTMHEFTAVYARITKFTRYLVLICVALYAGLACTPSHLEPFKEATCGESRETLPNPGRNTYRSSLSTIVPVSTQGVYCPAIALSAEEVGAGHVMSAIT